MNPRPGTAEKYEAVKALLISGSTLSEAIKQVGMARPTYRAMAKQDATAFVFTGKRGRKYGSKNKSTSKTATPTFVDIPLRASDEKTIVIVCNSSSLKSVLEGLL